MNYLTNYYKNLSEDLQRKINFLEKQIHESTGALTASMMAMKATTPRKFPENPPMRELDYPPPAGNRIVPPAGKYMDPAGEYMDEPSADSPYPPAGPIVPPPQRQVPGERFPEYEPMMEVPLRDEKYIPKISDSKEVESEEEGYVPPRPPAGPIEQPPTNKIPMRKPKGRVVPYTN